MIVFWIRPELMKDGLIVLSFWMDSRYYFFLLNLKLFHFQPLKVFQNYPVKLKVILILNQRGFWLTVCSSMASAWAKRAAYLVSHSFGVHVMYWICLIDVCNVDEKSVIEKRNPWTTKIREYYPCFSFFLFSFLLSFIFHFSALKICSGRSRWNGRYT